MHKDYVAVPNPNDCEMHAHEMYELYYFIQGLGSYNIEGTEYELCPGDILLMRPSEAHTLSIKSTKPYEYVSIHFLPSVFNGMIDETKLLRPFTRRPLGQLNLYRETELNNELLRAHILELANDEVSGDEMRTHTIAYLLPVIYELAMCYDKRHDAQDYKEKQGSANDIIGYVNNHLFEQINLETISERFFLSKSQVNRIFKSATGSAVWEYVMIKRLLFARERIKAGEAIGDVSRLCGFNDYSSFYRAYKKHFGSSPTLDAPKSK